MTAHSSHHGETRRRLSVVVGFAAAACLATVALSASTSSAAVSPGERAVATAAAGALPAGSFEIARGGGGHGGGGGGGGGGHNKDYSLKDVDPIYGGGRGRDAYGASLNADPYRAGTPRKEKNLDKDRSYAELYGTPKKKKPQCDDPDDCLPEERRTLTHEDQTEQNRAAKIAQRLQDHADRENGDNSDDDKDND